MSASTHQPPARIGIVLCGGKSTRMGLAKAQLPFGAETMLQRVVRLLDRAVERLVVVAAPGQELLHLPDNVCVAHDLASDRGPLEGMRAGMLATTGWTAAYVAGCDSPLLTPAFVERMFALLEGHAIAVPCLAGRFHPLAAAYRPDVLPVIERLLSEDRLRPLDLFDAVPTRQVAAEELSGVDPRLGTLMNLNCPADYFEALAAAGLAPAPEITQALLGGPVS